MSTTNPQLHAHARAGLGTPVYLWKEKVFDSSSTRLHLNPLVSDYMSSNSDPVGVAPVPVLPHLLKSASLGMSPQSLPEHKFP
ncbi:hypothetical protein AOLI_G00151720 [Acnodon oligacanthus]